MSTQLVTLKQGKKYVCIKAVIIKGVTCFVEGDTYLCCKDGKLIDRHGTCRELNLMQRECFVQKSPENHGYWEKMLHAQACSIYLSLIEDYNLSREIVKEPINSERSQNIIQSIEDCAIHMANSFITKLQILSNDCVEESKQQQE